MRHSLPHAPQFYLTAPQPCPYLHGRAERKLFTALTGDSANELNNTLSRQGFRRSQNVLYRPSCESCVACMSARVRVSEFHPSRTQKHIARRNSHLRRLATSALQRGYRAEALHEYRDAEGNPVKWRIRCKHPETGEKWIRPMHWTGTGYAIGEPEAPEAGRMLYRLPELLADPAEIVWIVEGEVCADAVTLCVGVGKCASLQHFIGGKFDAGNDVCGTERCLLNVGKEVFGIFV